MKAKTLFISTLLSLGASAAMSGALPVLTGDGRTDEALANKARAHAAANVPMAAPMQPMTRAAKPQAVLQYRLTGDGRADETLAMRQAEARRAAAAMDAQVSMAPRH